MSSSCFEWFNPAWKRVSLTDSTRRCVRENRASGEHGGPGLKLLDTAVSVDSFFLSEVLPSSLPPPTVLNCLFVSSPQREPAGLDICILSSMSAVWTTSRTPRLTSRELPDFCGSTSTDHLKTYNAMFYRCCENYNWIFLNTPILWCISTQKVLFPLCLRHVWFVFVQSCKPYKRIYYIYILYIYTIKCSFGIFLVTHLNDFIPPGACCLQY